MICPSQPFAIRGCFTACRDGTARPDVVALHRHRSVDVGPSGADLLPHFQVLRYDTRGHGASDRLQANIRLRCWAATIWASRML